MNYLLVDSDVESLAKGPVDAIEAAVGANPDLKETGARITGFGEEHSDWLYRTCLKGHLTGSGFVVSPSTRSVLLIHHKKLDRWLQPGGHADGDANLARVAAREVAEETGVTDLGLVWPPIDLDIHTVPEHGGEPEHDHLDVRFLFIADGELEIEGNHEVNSVKWFSIDDSSVGDLDSSRVWRRAMEVASQLTSY